MQEYTAPKKGDLVTLLYYNTLCTRNMNKSKLLDITIREAEVEKSGTKTMNVNGYQFYHEDVAKGKAKEGRFYNSNYLVVPSTDTDQIVKAIEGIKLLLETQRVKLITELEITLAVLKSNKTISVEDKR